MEKFFRNLGPDLEKRLSPVSRFTSMSSLGFDWERALALATRQLWQQEPDTVIATTDTRADLSYSDTMSAFSFK